MLYDELKKENLLALKEHNTTKRNILSVVITKSTILLTEKRAKNEELTDNDVLNIIRKVIKEVDDEANAFLLANRKEQYEELIRQKKILEVYLPKMMSKDEIIMEIEKLSDKSLPSIMKHFKTHFIEKVDMALVSEIARSYK